MPDETRQPIPPDYVWRWKNFTRKELECKCGCGAFTFTADFLDALQELRDEFGKPMPVTSGSRCAAHNQKVSTTGPEGPHTREAVDVAVSGDDAMELAAIARDRGFSGIGMNQKGPYPSRFVHLDMLPDAPGQKRPHCWTY